MGQSKKQYEKAINDFIAHLYSHADGDDDYQYEMYRERQMEAEREALELNRPEIYGDLYNER